MIYIVLTIIEIFLLLFGGMPLFDSITLSLGTAGTGGSASKTTALQAIPPIVRSLSRSL